jgi:hypothetical protein
VSWLSFYRYPTRISAVSGFIVLQLPLLALCV